MNLHRAESDRAWLAWLMVGAALITLVPWLVGQAMRPTGYEFQGNTILSPGDPAVYYSYIEQARHGALLMRDVFTSEPQAATLWQPVWLVLGWTANIFQLTTPMVFVVGRVVSTLVFVLTVWWATGWLWPERNARRIATLLVLGASGLGGIVAWLSGMNFAQVLQLPPDLWVSEMVPIISSWASPHFLLVTSGFLFVLVAVERSWLEKSWRLILWAGVVSLVTLSIHPFHALTWLVLWVGLTIWRSLRAKKILFGYIARWAMVLLMSLPAIVYYVVGLLVDPIIQGRAVENINLTPSWWEVFIGLGGVGVLAVVGAWRMVREKNRQLAWLVAWAIAYLVVIFLPFNSQRRLMQGMIIPFALLAAPIVITFWHRWGVSRLQQGVLILVLVGTLMTSTIATAGWIIGEYSQERRGRDHWEYFLSPEYQKLFSFVKSRIAPDRPILASSWDSILLGGFTARTVVSGHPVETLHFQEKSKAVKRFYGQADEQQQAAIIDQYRICYILDGPREKTYGDAFQPEHWPDLNIAWSGPTMTLYRVATCPR